MQRSPTDWTQVRRGELWWVDLEPARPGEANKTHVDTALRLQLSV